MLSAAAAALLTTPALAVGPTTITTVVTTAQKTSDTGDLTINSGGGINFKSATIPALTIDSSNNVNSGGIITDSDQTTATAVSIDANGLTGSFLNNGTIDLTGTGTSKKAIYLTGSGNFIGNITLGDSSIVSMVGDSSTGITTDTGTTLNGDWQLGGSFSMSPTNANETAASTILIGNFLGITNGNIVIATGANYSAVGNGTQGIVIAGPINACNSAAVPSCTEIGTFANSGSLTVAGVAVRNNQNTNVESGSALSIENSIAGGILNNGPATAGDATAAATISANGAGNAPTVLISPSLSVTNGAMTIGKDTTDVNFNFSFINRGVIAAAPEDSNVSSNAMLISGTSTIPVKFLGGLFNSGSIVSTATSITPGSAVNSTALIIGSFVDLPEIYVSAQAAGSSVGGGAIRSVISGPQGGIAEALAITGAPTGTGTSQVINTFVPKITIERGASIAATAAAAVPTGTTISTLTAIGIQDVSNSLTTIDNFGAIAATASLTDATTGATVTLTGGALPITHAVDVSQNSVGLNFTNNGSVTGDVLFGSGSDTYTVQGTSPSDVATHAGAINFGFSLGGSGTDSLVVGSFSNVAGAITAQGNLAVDVQGTQSVLNVQNLVGSDLSPGQSVASTALQVTTLHVAGGSSSTAGTIDLTVSQSQGTNAVVIASQAVTFDPGANLGVEYGSLIATSGTTQNFFLISAPTGHLNISDSDVQRYDAQVDGTTTGEALPFLFNSAHISKANDNAGHDVLELTVSAKTVDELALTGYARQIFTFANTAIAQDAPLGAAIIAGINSQADAQKAYDAFVPDVSGGVRQVAISLTDQATGAVASRLRDLRMFAKEPGDLTLWGTEFGEYLSTHGDSVKGVAGVNEPASCTASCGNVALNGFKDHGFGFSLGLDEGSPSGGWYGAAFTFYTGDVAELGDRLSKTTTLWYMLTGYSTWRGKGLFMDAQFNVGYGDFKGRRDLELVIPSTNSSFLREADSKRAGLVGSIGVTLGAQMKYGPFVNIPQISFDGMSMREEGYTEQNGGTGMDLTVQPYYGNSLRAFVGDEIRTSINLGDFYIQPAARAGYRFDFLNDPTKIRAQFADVNSTLNGNQPGGMFTVTGPDPSRGNFVAGGAINATTDNWTIGLNYDFVRGTNNATEQVGAITLLGRI
jgi:hypothetical protein